MLRQRHVALLLILAAFLACGGGGSLQTAVFTNNSGEPVKLGLEVPAPQDFSRGLMFREELPEDQGMLFDWGGQVQRPFWMKDTLIPLSIAFVSADGVIVDIQDMQPRSTDLHYSAGPYTFAIEVNQGWFEKHGIVPGSHVELPVSHRTTRS